MAYRHSSAPRAGGDQAKRGVQVVVRVRPTAQFAHGALIVDPERNKVDIKLDSSHEAGEPNNQVKIPAAT